jgi:hypothetical protein
MIDATRPGAYRRLRHHGGAFVSQLPKRRTKRRTLLVVLTTVVLLSCVLVWTVVASGCGCRWLPSSAAPAVDLLSWDSIWRTHTSRIDNTRTTHSLSIIRMRYDGDRFVASRLAANGGGCSGGRLLTIVVDVAAHTNRPLPTAWSWLTKVAQPSHAVSGLWEGWTEDVGGLL